MKSTTGVIDLPRAETLRPDQAIGEMTKLAWQKAIGMGVTASGDFEVINSALTAERAVADRMGQTLIHGAGERRVGF